MFVDSLCGGDGVCGKCRVIVRRGLVRGGTTDFLTREQIREGFILACEATVASNLLVEVPVESDIHSRLRETDVAEQRPSEIAALERMQPAEVDPLVRKHCFKVDEPTLENNRSDLERLKHKLGALEGGQEYQMGLKVIRRLPEVIRDPSRTATPPLYVAQPPSAVDASPRAPTTQPGAAVPHFLFASKAAVRRGDGLLPPPHWALLALYRPNRQYENCTH